MDYKVKTERAMLHLAYDIVNVRISKDITEEEFVEYFLNNTKQPHDLKRDVVNTFEVLYYLYLRHKTRDYEIICSSKKVGKDLSLEDLILVNRLNQTVDMDYNI